MKKLFYRLLWRVLRCNKKFANRGDVILIIPRSGLHTSEATVFDTHVMLIETTDIDYTIPTVVGTVKEYVAAEFVDGDNKEHLVYNLIPSDYYILKRK